MAKPIPVNRRWIENQKAREGAGEAIPLHSGVPRRPVRRANYGLTLRELLEQLRTAVQATEPQAIEYRGQGVFVAAPPAAPEVIPARYEQICSGCGERIRAGMPIARHPVWREWVHADCLNRQQRMARRVIEARYAGTCRRCRRSIQPGQRITRHDPYGWIHLECVETDEE